MTLKQLEETNILKLLNKKYHSVEKLLRNSVHREINNRNFMNRIFQVGIYLIIFRRCVLQINLTWEQNNYSLLNLFLIYR